MNAICAQVRNACKLQFMIAVLLTMSIQVLDPFWPTEGVPPGAPKKELSWVLAHLPFSASDPCLRN